MKLYTGKTLDAVLAQIAKEQNVAIEDITYELSKKSGIGIFSKVEVLAYTSNDVYEFGRQYLADVVEALGFTQEITMTETKRGVLYTLVSDNNPILIGHAGSTLKSLEYLIKTAINAKFKKFYEIRLDINGYLDMKDEKLEKLARRVAREVGKTKIDAVLDPMCSYDRRIIHKTLQEIHYVETKSYGEGKGRHLVVHYNPEGDRLKKKAIKE